MKMIKRFVLHQFIGYFILIAGFASSGKAQDILLNSYEQLWKKYDTLANSDERLQSARVLADSICCLAKAEQNYPEVIRALIAYLKMSSQIDENIYVEAIDRIKSEINHSPFPLKPVLQVLLAEHYWGYYQQNRWEFQNRTATINFSDDDMRTWDLRTISEKTGQTYLCALENSTDLKQIPLRAFQSIISDVNAENVKFRPTLYDLIVHRAIDYFDNEEPDLVMPAYKFVLDSEKYFQPCPEFVKMVIESKDTTSLKLRALKLFQDLITFHLNDSSATALVSTDLKRLRFVHQFSVIENKDDLYLEALNALEGKYQNTSVAAEIIYEIASEYSRRASLYDKEMFEEYRWHYTKAFNLCNDVITEFPGTPGAQSCKLLKNNIGLKKLGLYLEKEILPDRPSKAFVSYRNIKTIYLRTVKITDLDYETIIYNDSTDEQQFKHLTSLSYEKSWSVDLPDPGDYQLHSTEIIIPPTGIGFYLLLASSSPDFEWSNNISLYSSYRCSNISFINRNSKGVEYYIFNRNSGTPLKGVTINTITKDFNRKDHRFLIDTTLTLYSDENGQVIIPDQTNGNYLQFSYGNDVLWTMRPHFREYIHQEWDKKICFFTDRALYRPGQTVYFKGINIEKINDSCALVKNEIINIFLYDANHTVVDSLTLKTNDFGSFNGSFTLPKNSLNGQMVLRANAWQAHFNVEEYKRPKFEVTVKPVTETYHVHDTITVTGTAKSFSGAAISRATVKYHVTREATYPGWSYWWNPVPRSPAMEIVNSSVLTNDTGAFSISFSATPDLTITKEKNPRFNYRISIDVTDINGETRSVSASVTAAYSLVNIQVSIPSFVDSKKDSLFPITITNTNGNPVPQKGNFTVFRLKMPENIMRDRLWSTPDTMSITKSEHEEKFPNDVYCNENDYSTWKRVETVTAGTFDTRIDTTILLSGIQKWTQGMYVLEAITIDSSGQEVKDLKYFTVYDKYYNSVALNKPDIFIPVKTTCNVGEKAAVIIGSAYENTKILFEIEHRNKIIHSEWITINGNQKLVEIPVLSEYRGNFAVHFAFVKNNRVYTHSELIVVPWSDKELKMEFETFRNKLLPGEKEEWKIKIRGPGKNKIAVEMVATLYDESLDAITPNSWNFSIYPYAYFKHQWTSIYQHVINFCTVYDNCYHDTSKSIVFPELFGARNIFKYPEFKRLELMRKIRHLEGERQKLSKATDTKMAFADRNSRYELYGRYEKLTNPRASMSALFFDNVQTTLDTNQSPEPDLSTIPSRSNLNETAFFFPDLYTDRHGVVTIKFTIPEALTKWKMLGFAHTRDLQYGLIRNECITQKELMVVPNAPRFFRENDTILFSAKIANLSDANITGTAQLFLVNAATMQPVDNSFGNTDAQQTFSIKKGLSTSLFWRLKIPEDIGAVCYKVVAKAGKFSDGEENSIPVLSNRTLVTETLPLQINEKGEKNLTFSKLISQNNKSSTLKNHRLTLEFTSNPAWYAVQALPYLMEYPFECTEQTFSRYFANSIATYIVNSSPEIKSVFQSWKTDSPDAFLSNLEKNQELKELIKEETPWLLDGKNESENKKRVALLFDLNRMTSELESTLRRLQRLQISNGSWPWFEGGSEDRYITQYIITGLGKLNNIKVVDYLNNRDIRSMIERAIPYLDSKICEDYKEILRNDTQLEDNLGYLQIQYIYMRSFFKDIPISKDNEQAFNFFFDQAKNHWQKKGPYMQGMIALGLNRYNENKISSKIMISLKERSIYNEEMGMYWKEMYETNRWHWYQAPIETQALLIEAFDEVSQDSQSVENMKIWLLKSKQTENWKTTKATTEAIYSLLLRGGNWLKNDPDLSISLGTEVIDWKVVKKEAGTGYFKTSWDKSMIKPDMGTVTVTKRDPGVTWGGIYWQYFEQLDKITPHETPLKLSRTLFKQVYTDEGIKLGPIGDNDNLRVGDKLIVRIELQVDRDMEYVHMKDMRASGFEPVNVLSGYRYQNGLGYYECTRDAATNFFFSYLRKGMYVFEYPLFVTHSGDFSNGITSIQCMYAPEFTNHSEGLRVKVIK